MHPPIPNLSDGKLNCPLCPSTFVGKYHYARHCGNVHGIIYRLFRRDGLQIEEEPNPLISLEQQMSGIVCDGCKETFASKETIKLHTCHSLLDKIDKIVSNERVSKVSYNEESPAIEKKRKLLVSENIDDEIEREMDRIHNDTDESEEPLEKKSKIQLEQVSADDPDSSDETDSSSDDQEESNVPRDKLCKGCDKRYPVKDFSSHIKSSNSKCAKYMFS